MAIDFTFSQDVEDARLMMRQFLHGTVKPAFAAMSENKEATRDDWSKFCLLYTSPSPRDVEESRMPSSA